MPHGTRGHSTGRQAQTGQVKFAMLGISQEIGIRNHDRGNSPQPSQNFSGVIEPTHLRVAGSMIAIRDRETGILLDRKEQFRHRLIEPPT
jgi:hypothetical protein